MPPALPQPAPAHGAPAEMPSAGAPRHAPPHAQAHRGGDDAHGAPAARADVPPGSTRKRGWIDGSAAALVAPSTEHGVGEHDDDNAHDSADDETDSECSDNERSDDQCDDDDCTDNEEDIEHCPCCGGPLCPCCGKHLDPDVAAEVLVYIVIDFAPTHADPECDPAVKVAVEFDDDFDHSQKKLEEVVPLAFRLLAPFMEEFYPAIEATVAALGAMNLLEILEEGVTVEVDGVEFDAEHFVRNRNNSADVIYDDEVNKIEVSVRVVNVRPPPDANNINTNNA